MDLETKKLFLLDAYALIYRAYYALIRTPRITSKGLNTSAIFGFCNTLQEVLTKEAPSHIAVCFDPPGRTFRHDMYDQYKANREAQPEDISLSLPYIKDLIRAWRIPIFEVDGYEADDVIGTLASHASAQGFTTYMMTPDKDYAQLVTDSILMYKPSLRGTDFELRGPQQVCDLFGVSSPRQVIDLLALEGDKIDNIPGCRGVGPKGAQTLIAQYGSVENLLQHAADIPGALGKKIRDNAADIRFSKNLATIRTDVPLNVDFDTMRRQPADIEALRNIYKQLEFKTFLNRLNSPGTPTTSSTDNISNSETPHQLDLFGTDTTSDAEKATPGIPIPQGKAAPAHTDYQEIETLEQWGEIVKRCATVEAVGFALYAPGEEAMRATILGVALCWAPGEAAYLRLPPEKELRLRYLQLLEPLMTSPTTTLVSVDIKRDIVLLDCEKIQLTAPYFDVTLAHYLLQPEMTHRLADMAHNILGFRIDAFADTATQLRHPYAAVPSDKQLTRLCQQADASLRLRQPLQQAIDAQGSELQALTRDIELPLVRVLAQMEIVGVRIDAPYLVTLSAELSRRLADLESEAYQLADQKFNIGSPSQVGEILFGKLALDPQAKRTPSGAYSTTEDILQSHRQDHPIVEVILRARALRKLLATYVNALPQMLNPHTGHLHTTFSQTTTATGRVSSSNPNLQNIPVRSDDGRDVRRAFIADPGCLILSVDYSQIELRLLADFSDDPDLIKAFSDDSDIHTSTASKIFHVPLDEVTPDQRRQAKTANFGTVYGISAFGLSQRLGIPRAEAKALIDGYFRTYPHIRQYLDKAVQGARDKGYVQTPMGRRRYLRDINSRNATVRGYAERNAVNAPLQGAAADIIKIAMVTIYAQMQALNLRSRLIMQVHDELIFNVVPEELPQLQSLVIKAMEGAYPASRVPLKVSAGTGTNWLEAH